MRTEEIGGGSMLTEFGLCYPNISNPLDKNTIGKRNRNVFFLPPDSALVNF